MTATTYHALAIEEPEYYEHPDILHLCLPADDGTSTGIRVASIEPDRHQTAGGDYQTSPDWYMARLLAAAPRLMQSLTEVCAALEDSNSSAYQTLADARAVLSQIETPTE